jgi:sulfide dehydrogenase [flavocytochrome c] flavoprotein chain
MRRREFLKLAAAFPLAGCAASAPTKARVVVVGGGYGGTTAAKYIRMWDPSVDVVLVEREREFISCPLSNLVLGGSRSLDELRRGYDGLRKYGVQVVHDEAISVDAAKKIVRLARGGDLAYERLIVSPAVDFLFNEVEGYERAMQAGSVLHAWKAGPQTLELRKRLVAMPDGGVYVLSVPTAPYRCPPGPYERACQVAHYFKQAKPRSKVLLLDANPDVVSKGPLFKRAWEELYKGIVEYRSGQKAVGIESNTVKLEFDSVNADVLNVLPPQRAADIALKAGLITHNDRWCDVDWRSCESKAIKGVHVLGDATLSANAMPKSGHMANSMAKVCAAAVVALLNGREPDPAPVMNNTCYSFVSDKEVIHVASVHQWDAAQNSILPVKGAGGVSAARSEQEGRYAWSWAQNIWADMLG